MKKNSLNENDKKSNDSNEDKCQLKKEITLINGIGIVIGSMIGSGIFISPTGVYLKAGSSGAALVIWMLCGVFSMIGAYCYIELGCIIKRSSGDYAYIYQAFGPFLAFVRLWIDVIVTRPCCIAIVSLTFAEYILEPMFLNCVQPIMARRCLAASCILLLTFINCWSVKASTRVQDIFTFAKLLALVIVILTGVVKLCMGFTSNWESPFSDTNTDIGQLTMGFYNGLFAYCGWNYLNCMMEEMKNPVKDLPKAVLISCSIVTVVYMLANVSYFTILSPIEIKLTNAVAVRIGLDNFSVMWWVIPMFVSMSTFGGVNGIIMTTSRMFLVAAQSDQMPASLAMISTSLSTPIPSVIFVSLVSMVYLVYPDMYVLMNYVGFVTWLTFAFAILALLYFRFSKKYQKLERPFTVHLIFPIVYLLVSAFIIVFAFVGGFYESMMGTIIMLTAVPVYLIGVKWKKPKSFNRKLGDFTKFVQKLFIVVATEPDESLKLS
uniref:Slc7a-7 n=1 Tax=Schmidtea mediterranea TaxID=79327 RepID=A0A0H3YIW3_SCHMD|nr:slc7a-7 [Schmidtea mediterranea]